MPENHKTKLVLFDLDGTLVDTAPDFKNSINYMLNELNETEVSLEEIRNWVGYGARELIRRPVVDKNIPQDEKRIEEMLKIFLLHYTHNIDDDSVLFNNVKNVLEFLKNNGINHKCWGAALLVIALSLIHNTAPTRPY